VDYSDSAKPVAVQLPWYIVVTPLAIMAEDTRGVTPHTVLTANLTILIPIR